MRTPFLLPLAAMMFSAAMPASAAPKAPAASAATAVPAEVVVAAARKEVLARYVLPETATKLDAALAAAGAAHAFDSLQGEALANKVNDVMRTVTKDAHLSMTYAPEMAAALAGRPLSDDEDGELPPEFIRQITRDNGGVAKLEVLPGNIRYLDYRGFEWGAPAATEAIANAMAFLRGGDAVIIDLRANGGGSPDAVAAMASYFLPPATKLMRFEMRSDAGQATATHAPPFSLAGKPVYVLTSKRTFSAAEEFASHVSAFGFGTLVGENTGGGGFRNTILPLPGGHVMSISVGRAVHALTGQDWEAVGVAPKIAVPADQALIRARSEAMAAIVAAAPASERPAAERILAYYRALAAPIDSGRQLADYEGRYGERTIARDAAGNLTTRRGDNPPTRLVAIGPDTFVPENTPTQRFSFVADGSAIVALDADGPGGQPQRAARAALALK